MEQECGGVVRSESVRTDLQAAAKAAAVLVPHVGVEFGGHGLETRARAVVFEEALVLAKREAEECEADRRDDEGPQFTPVEGHTCASTAKARGARRRPCGSTEAPTT